MVAGRHFFYTRARAYCPTVGRPSRSVIDRGQCGITDYTGIDGFQPSQLPKFSRDVFRIGAVVVVFNVLLLLFALCVLCSVVVLSVLLVSSYFS